MRTSFIPTKRLFVFILGLSTTAALLSASWPGRVQPLASIKDPVHSSGQTESAGMSGTQSKLTTSDKTALARMSEAYGKLPLSFEANEGQFDSRVEFVSRSAGNTLYLTTAEAVLNLAGSAQIASPSRPAKFAVPEPQRRANVESDGATLRMKLVGANHAARARGIDELPGKSNYFIGNDPKKWRVNVPTYAKVKYEQVYPGVDLVYYGNQRELEYDLIVAPGADPRHITLAFEGAQEMRIDATGSLVVTTPTGSVRQHKPVAYQETGGQRKKVRVHYVRRGPNQVGFEIASYNARAPLTIDPVLSYSTYVGGSRFDQAYGVAVDFAGNAYVTGITTSTDFPVTSNAFQRTNGGAGFGSSDTFIFKLNSTGNFLSYSTYLGGHHDDAGYGIAVNSAGEAFIAGYTRSTNFPTTPGSFQPSHSGSICAFGEPCTEAFITKLSASGSALFYSTYLSGHGAAVANGIALDSAGSAYITGTAYSTDFPTTPGAFQPAFGGGSDDAFVTKLNAAGSALEYSTYLGGARIERGNGEDFGFGIAVDSSGNAYISGATESGNFPTTPGAFDPVGDGGDTFNAFVTKLNQNGSALVYSTYLTGGTTDIARAIALDITGNAYVTGETNSSNFPTTPGAFQVSGGGFGDAFITKLNTTGSALIYSTYLGGSTNSDSGYAIAVDSSGNAYVTGQARAIDFPTTPDAFQLTGGVNGDAFVTKLNAPGTALLYSSYLGGGDFDFGAGIAIDPSRNAYVIGATYSSNFPVTPNSYQPINSGDSDAFVAKITEIAPYDLCLQDETTGATLRVNSTTGDYQFTSCGGVTLLGTAAVTRRGCLITLQVNGPDRRLLARIDTCSKNGFATIQLFSLGTTFSVLDRNTANNICACSR